ncbi:PIN domain-containing protein [Candidatus Binatia bacterium]|nr:PIN domain-containing protein [Candidatus Binatia bacterium]
MPGVIDTNLFLYAANSDADEHRRARDFLARVGGSRDPWYVTDGILYEFLRVSTHPKVFPKPLTWREGIAFLQPLIDADNIHVINSGDPHWKLLSEVLAEITHPSGNLFFDVRTAVLMREHGVRRIYTTDTDFLQFSRIEVVNPLRS